MVVFPDAIIIIVLLSYPLQQFSRRHTLTISDITREDGGNYSCKINEQLKTSADLLIEGEWQGTTNS